MISVNINHELRPKSLPGYSASFWLVECGGNRRQKAASGKLDAQNGVAKVTTSHNGRWNVMMIWRAPGELFLGGTMSAFTGPPPFGWLQRLDPQTLAVEAESVNLPCGDHVWCGAIAAHQNGYIFKVNGCYVHRLNRDCQVILERKLPVDQAHNGLLILSDGSIITKDLRLAGQGASTVTRLNPDSLALIGPPLTLTEGSMGRIASDITPEGEFIYIPGIERVWRLRVLPKSLEVDTTWCPQYRVSNGPQGLAWDGCISDGALWLMDNGDIDSVRAIYSVHPNGRFDQRDDRLSWRRPAPWTGRQRLLRICLSSGDITTIEPFPDAGGGLIAPPVHVPELNMCIAWDSINGGLAGISTAAGSMKVVWTMDARPSMQPVVFPDSGELVINDFQGGEDHLIVVDILSGQLIDRVDTGSRLANGMFLTPGVNQDIYYCSTQTVARVQWL